MKFAGPISAYMKGQHEFKFVAEITHFKDIPEFGSDENFVVIGITDGGGNTYAQSCVVVGKRVPQVGHWGKFRSDVHPDGFITVELHRG